MIGKTLLWIPAFVDHFVVVDDASRDRTEDIVKHWRKENSRIVYLSLQRNKGVGGAIATGYK